MSSSPKSIPPPPAGTRRNPLSDPEKTLSKKARSCQFCFDKPGTLVCSACKVHKYCSKECQKKDWPAHRKLCKRNQTFNTLATQDRFQNQRDLRAFTSKHIPIITTSALHSMRPWEDKTRHLRDVLQIRLRRRQGPCRTETSYFALDACVISMDDLDPLLRDAVKDPATRKVAPGIIGQIYVVLFCEDEANANLSPALLRAPDFNYPSRTPADAIVNWKPLLLSMLNEGIIE